MPTNLQEIGKRYGTDKADAGHSFRGMSYLDVYQTYFDAVAFGARHVLELGVYYGASLKTWRDAFPDAQIWGVDIDSTRNVNHGPGIHIITGSQADPAALAQVAPGQQLDVVVDDGSHLVDHILESFRLLWPRLRSGGLYCIEDLACTYGDRTPEKDVWPGQNLNPPGTNFRNDRAEMERFLLEGINRMDGLGGDARFIHFWPMQIIIKKV